MFQFVQPILLFSIAAIAIPVMVHLWNVRQGKTLKVGSISLLIQGSKQNAKSLKFNNLLLLLLRCVLITLLASLLAKPLLQRRLFTKKEKGWILMEKESLNENYGRNKSEIDSFVRNGFEFHYFNRGFAKDDLTAALKAQNNTLASQLKVENQKLQISHSVSYWTLLRELNQMVPAELPVVVFVKNSLDRFNGERPSVSLNLTLKTYIPADTVSTFIAQAFLDASDSIHLKIGHSKPTGTFYTQKSLPYTTMSTPDYIIKIINGRLTAALNAQTGMHTNTSFVEVDTSTVRVTLFADKFSNDLKYVKAAIESIKTFTKRKMQLFITSSYKDIKAGQDWLFWLSEQHIPSAFLTKNIFSYEEGKVQKNDTWIITGDENDQDKQPLKLAKRIVKKISDNEMEWLWLDGFGDPLLCKEVKSNTSFYHFFSRFDPGWNDLVWREEFPALIAKLLFNEEGDDRKYDRRMLDEKQAQPILLPKKDVRVKDKFIQNVDLTYFMWLAAFILFFFERLISFRNKKVVLYG